MHHEVPTLTEVAHQYASGVPIIFDGEVIGSVGTSGIKPEQDVQLAKAAVKAII